MILKKTDRDARAPPNISKGLARFLLETEHQRTPISSTRAVFDDNEPGE